MGVVSLTRCPMIPQGTRSASTSVTKGIKDSFTYTINNIPTNRWKQICTEEGGGEGEVERKGKRGREERGSGREAIINCTFNIHVLYLQWNKTHYTCTCIV